MVPQGDREEYSGDRERERKLQEGAVLPKRRFENQAGGGQEERHRLFISNLSFNTDWMVLKDHFKQIAPVAYVRVLQVSLSALARTVCELSFGGNINASA